MSKKANLKTYSFWHPSSLINVGKPARKNGSNLASKSTFMREGAAKSDKFLIF